LILGQSNGFGAQDCNPGRACHASLVTVITVHHRLDQEWGLSQDKQLARRTWPADQISRYAQDSLGPRFLEVEMISTRGTSGPSTAVFRFDPWPGGERNADEIDRQQVVA
jgi:hypothetical protein